MTTGQEWLAAPEKLAIFVAYYFGDELKGLIDLHLQQIRRNTAMPYRIYGCALRLDPRRVAYLRGFPELEVFEDLKLPAQNEGDFASRTHYEHNGLLELLRAQAASDGATHFVTLHQDSFPVRRDWDTRLRQHLAQGDAFATVVPYSYNACLFWDRAWQEQNVPLLVDGAERRSSGFCRFRELNDHMDTSDGGVGFLYHAWRDERSWHALPPSGPNIWGGDILHMVGATRMTRGAAAPTRVPPWLLQRLRRGATLTDKFLKPEHARLVRERLRRAVVNPSVNTGRAGSLGDKKSQIAELVRDPDGFIASCSDGSLTGNLSAGQSV